MMQKKKLLLKKPSTTFNILLQVSYCSKKIFYLQKFLTCCKTPFNKEVYFQVLNTMFFSYSII